MVVLNTFQQVQDLRDINPLYNLFGAFNRETKNKISLLYDSKSNWNEILTAMLQVWHSNNAYQKGKEKITAINFNNNGPKCMEQSAGGKREGNKVGFQGEKRKPDPWRVEVWCQLIKYEKKGEIDGLSTVELLRQLVHHEEVVRLEPDALPLLC